jgi:L-ascorbate metabolism protein UlaG (beta-lactamase superfamily)
MVDVRWTGAAGLEFTHNGQTILIDPYHSRPGKLKVFFGRLLPDISAIESYLEKLPGNLSAIIVGHTHFDHALDIPEFSRRFDGPLVGSPSLEKLMAMHNMTGRVTVCEGNTRIELLGDAAVTMIPSMHGLVLFGRIPYSGDLAPGVQPPLKASQYRHGAVYIPKLEIGGKTFMHVGSANFIESELHGHQCDVLFMCVPGWKNRPGYPARLLEITKPNIVVPFHYDDFTAPIHTQLKRRNVPFVDMKGFLNRINESASDIEIRVPQPFESMTF